MWEKQAIFLGDIPLHSPYIGLIYGRYLHFRILKFPLIKWPVWGIYPQFQTHPNEGLSKSKLFLVKPGRRKHIPSGNETWQFNIPNSCGFDCFNGKIIEHSWGIAHCQSLPCLKKPGR